jgi:hypothetical protein
MGMGVAPRRKKDPGKLYHELWWWLLIFLTTLLCPNQCQFWQNMMMFVVGFWFKQAKHWELNRKRRTIIYVRKPRKKDKKEWYLFQRPSIPPRRRGRDVPIQELIRKILKKIKKLERVRKKKKKPIQKFVDLLLEKWKKKTDSGNEGTLKAFFAINNFPLAFSASNEIMPISYDPPKEIKETEYVANCSDGLPIVFDTGCSMSVTPNFIGDLEPSPTESLQGLKGKVKVVGVGRVSWTVFDLHGITRTIKTKAYFIPDGNIRLFSTQSYFQENKGGSGEITANGITLDTSNLPSHTTNNQTSH